MVGSLLPIYMLSFAAEALGQAKESDRHCFIMQYPGHRRLHPYQRPYARFIAGLNSSLHSRTGTRYANEDNPSEQTLESCRSRKVCQDFPSQTACTLSTSIHQVSSSLFRTSS